MNSFLARHRHPDELYGRIQNMVAFAKNQGTDVPFVIVPQHFDFQQRVQDFGLADESARFRRELNDLGVRVIDYDYPNAVTAEKSNFRDPLHCSGAVASMIVNEVFGGENHVRPIEFVVPQCSVGFGFCDTLILAFFLGRCEVTHLLLL